MSKLIIVKDDYTDMAVDLDDISHICLTDEQCDDGDSELSIYFKSEQTPLYMFFKTESAAVEGLKQFTSRFN